MTAVLCRPEARFRWLLVAGLLLACVLGAACSGPPLQTSDWPSESDQSPTQRRAVLRLELADVYLRRGQPLVALDEVKQALALSPELPTAWSLRGLVYLQMRDEARALASFDRAHQLAPNDPDVLHNRGWLLCQQARPGPVMDQAQLLLQRALAQPDYAHADRSWLALARCQERAGELARALESLARPELERASQAQTLWQAARLARRLDNAVLLDKFGMQLQTRFSQSPQAMAFDQGAWDE